ncbi:YCF48-related protein [Planctopirus hydrillae]|uniref:Photosynthesis system II assembly factor Ycf48/Hcf136-like domain-containing protein n=1 Tax=Planctopirus hydrillae TaxID=1841610 RepID=A0A1C3EMF4_9PLAN|nr:YCF48-related protein [Planctopirus hydrillae]ODA34433.1 hypothetical protein A6X21_17385 [Planctopirus hydrillae]
MKSVRLPAFHNQPSIFHGPLTRIVIGWCVAIVGMSLSLTMSSKSLLASEPVHSAATPLQDDATLRAVCTVGKKHIFVVGDRGVVWISNDAGATWRFSLAQSSHAQGTGSPRLIHLKCAQFVTDQIGWVGGCVGEPSDHHLQGVLLSTTDGGMTWQELGAGQLPPVQHVQFFDMDQAAVVVAADDDVPTGVMRTVDGGTTWHRLAGQRQGHWKTAAWFSPEMGLVAGSDLKISLVGDEQLLPSKMPGGSLRTLRSAFVTKDERGWLVGDGATVLTTTNGGIVWDLPRGEFPPATRKLMDFRGVHGLGEHVWIVGSPGSVIWHSPNAGQTWENISTGETAPLEAVRFVPTTADQLDHAATGYAVGHLGLILKTTDSGKTWKALRGGGRRAALTIMPARTERISSWALAKASGEQGYRSSVILLSAGLDAKLEHEEGLIHSASHEELRRAGVLLAGGNALEECWAFPLSTPGMQHNREALFRDWMLKTENKLPEMLLGQIVRHLRTWRPDVVMLDQPAADDAVAQLLFAAMCRAIPLAADATRLFEQQEVVGLAPWSVSRVLLRLPDGSVGDAQIEGFEFLPRTGVSVKTAAARADGLLQIQRQGLQQREAYRRLDPAQLVGGIGSLPAVSAQASQDLFAGLSISPGTAARRGLLPVDDQILAERMKAAAKLRNVESFTGQQLGDPRVAGQMLAQVGPILAGLDPAQGAAFLAQLARDYRQHDQYDLLEQTQLELIRRYPTSPEGTSALRWLVAYWTSGEMMYQLSRKEGSLASVVTADTRPTIRRVGANGEELANDDGSYGSRDRSPIVQARAEGRIQSGRGDYQSDQLKGRQKRAAELLAMLELQEPRVFQSSEVQFPLAALKRHRGSFGEADSIYRSLLIRQQAQSAEAAATISTDPIHQIAAMEMWITAATGASPGTIATSQYASTKPVLDGLLSDDCWQVAKDLRLQKPGLSNLELADQPRDFVMMAHDREFLYLAGKCHRHPGHRSNPVETSGRTYDAPLEELDRVRISLDIDRDYVSAYHFEISETGAVSESCWERVRWNPTWFVAVDGDAEGWRFEAAIAWSELAAQAPATNHVFAAKAMRILPAIETRHWPPATTDSSSTNSSANVPIGLIRFE